MKKCPYCAEEIQDEAIKCKHCGESLNIPSFQKLKEEPGGCMTQLIALFFPGTHYIIQGQLQKGLLYFLGAVIIGLCTVGIGGLIMGIISAQAVGKSSIYKCPGCKSVIEKDAIICKYCHAKFTKI